MVYETNQTKNDKNNINNNNSGERKKSDNEHERLINNILCLNWALWPDNFYLIIKRTRTGTSVRGVSGHMCIHTYGLFHLINCPILF